MLPTLAILPALAFSALGLQHGAVMVERASQRIAVMRMSARAPLFSFVGSDEARQETLSLWERIDDVIMGGVSSSRLVMANDEAGGVLFEGRLREQGGGFCGQRMKLLAEPLDLSAALGLYLDLDASDVQASSRVLKVAIRTRQDRGEVVYQRAFQPAAQGREVVQMPFSEFRLVRGPRLVPGVPPLSPGQANETYQISLVVSKFEVSESGAPLPSFREGPFSLRLFELGTYTDDAAAPARLDGSAAAKAVPRPLSEAEQAAAAPLAVRLLRPLFGMLFSEKARRRRAATLLLQSRNSTAVGRMRLAWAWRAAGAGGILGAARTTSAIMLRDVAVLALSLPVKLLFRLVGTISRAVRAMKERGGGRRGPPEAANA